MKPTLVISWSGFAPSTMMPSKLKAIKSKGLYHIKTAKKDGFENQATK